MTDAVSSIAFGIDTAEGLAHLVSLREAFAGLKTEIKELNELKANTQGISGAGAARNELATLGVELRNAQSRVSELEQQLQGLGKAQVASAKAVTTAVKQSVEEQARAVVDSEKRQAAETEAIAKKTTKTLEEEARKRASFSSSAKVAGGRVGVSESLDSYAAETRIRASMLAEQDRLNKAADAKRAAGEAHLEAEHRSLMFQSMMKDEGLITDLLAAHTEFQTKKAVLEAEAEAKHRALMFEGMMNDAKTEEERLQIAKAAAESRAKFEREVQQRRDLQMATAGSSATLAENAEAYKANLAAQNQEYQLFLMRQREYLQRHRDLEQTFREADRSAESQKLKAQNQQYQQHLMDQAIHLKEWKEIEALISADEKSANRLKLMEQDQQYKEYMLSIESYRQRQKDIEIAFQKAEEQEVREHLMREREEYQRFNAQYLAERKATMLDNKFVNAPLSTQVSITRNAAGLVNSGNSGLAHETYGSEAVAAVSKLAQMEAELNATRQKGTGIAKEARTHALGYKDGLTDVHSAVKGLTAGLDQMWLSWGSMVPLVAGFAITGSMMKILEVGKAVEFQLQYLTVARNGLAEAPLDLNKFVNITETSMESLHDAAGAIRTLAQTGMDAKSALIALPDVLNFATIGEMSATQSATALSGVMHTFNKEASNMGNIGDVIAKVSMTTNTTATQMVAAMKQASTSGSMFNLTLEETASALGIMATKGIVGSQAGTALSTALKNLYEPTSKAAKALKEMGVDTDDGHGGLKNTVDLIGELREKLSTLDGDGKVKFLGTITDARAMKALEALTSGFGKYKEVLDSTKNSSDFMLQGTLILEDTVEGGWRRMTNALEGSYVKAFTKAEPEIRKVQAQLADFAKSDDAINMLTKLAVAGARVTETLVENASIVLYAAGAYMALRVISTLSQGMVAWRLNTALATAATKAKTAATVEDTVATEANILTMDVQAASVLAAGRSLTFAATASRALAASLGPISMLLIAGYTAYEIFTARVNDSDLAMQKANNTVNTTINYYERQIEKLRELNKELKKNQQEGTDAERQTARAILLSQLKTGMDDVATAQAKVKKGPSYGEMMLAGQAAESGQVYETDGQKELAAAEARVAAASKGLEQLGKVGFEYKSLKRENQALQDKQSIMGELKRLKEDAGGGDDTQDGIRQLGTVKSRALMPKIQDLMDDIENGKIALKDAAPKLKELHDKVNEAKNKFTGPDTGDKDAYRAAQLKLDGQIQLHKDNEKSGLSDIKSNEKTGQLGEMDAIVKKYEVIKKARDEDLKDFAAKEALAASQEKRKADQQSIENKRQANIRAELEAQNEKGREIAELESKWAQESLKTEADTLKDRGFLYSAYLKEFASKHDIEMKGLDVTIKNTALPQKDRDAAQSRKTYLENQFNTGSDNALFDQGQALVQQKLAEMQEKLAAVAEKSARTNESARSPGFITDITAASKGDDIRAETADSVQGLLAGLKEIADKSDNPKLKASVSKMSSELVKEANKSRDAWIAAGKSIEKSLSDSFGKGGKAVGGIVSALIKQRETQKSIDDDLKKSKDAQENQDPAKQLELENKAREESTQLQLSSYGDIAGAAKGFFDEHSKGYAAMQTAERVFRAFEMAESVRSFLTKSGLLASFTSLFATSKATEVGLTEATVAPTVAAEGVKQGAFSITALAGALALPFPANLPAFAIVAAMLASIGIAVAGSGSTGTGPSLSEERQKYAGTGYTYDQDSKSNPYDWELEKSDSLAKSLENMKSNSDIALRYSSDQLSTLQKINDGISGMANSIVQSTGIRGTRADETALGVGSSKSFLAFSKTSTTLNDSGISFDPISQSINFMGMQIPIRGGGSILSQNLSQTVGSVMDKGVNAHSYADTTTKSSSVWGLFSSSDSNTTYGNLDKDLTDQMGLVVKSLYSSVFDAAKFLGKDNATLESALKGTTLREAGLDKISFKGMSTDEVEKTLNASFSKLGDIMAQKAMPGLEDFKKASEGYLDTLVRVSSGVDSAEYSLQRLGVTMVGYTTVLNKQGDVATEIVRDSLVAAETVRTLSADYTKQLGGIFGSTVYITEFTSKVSGIGEILQTMSGSASDLTDAYTKLTTIRNTMRVTGMKDADVTSSMVKGAGGMDNLSTGMNDFMDNFFTDAEKAAAKVTLLQEEFVKIGQPMPKSKEEFKTLAQSIDRTTEAGQTLYGALIALAGQFSDVADSSGAVSPALAKQKAIITGLVDTGKHWLDIMGNAKGLVNDLDDALAKTGKGDRTERISELQDLLNSGVGSFEQQLEIAGQLKDLVLEKYQTEKENAEKLIDFGKDMSKYVSSLKTGDLSPLTVKGKMESAMADYQTVLSNTSSTDDKVSQDARDQIQDRASTLLDLAHTYYASSQAYTDIFDSVSADLDKLGADTSNQGASLESLGKGQLSELQKLRDLAKGIEDAATNEYSSTVNQLATQITLMTSMDGSLSMLTELFASMPAQLAMSLGNKGVGLPDIVSSNNTAQDQIETMYSSILHRKSDDAGMQFWLDDYNRGGDTMDQIRELMTNSDEAKALKIDGSHANGLDYVPFDGYVAELHRGERVLTETEARRTDKASLGSTSSFSSNERDEMAAEIAALRKTVDRLVDAQVDGTKAIVRALGATSDDNAEKIVKGTKEAISSSDFDNRNKPVFQ